MDDEGSVINSSSASEKSVVILGCVSAEPKHFGCSEIERCPVGSTRRLSFSIPLVIPVKRSAFLGSLNKPILVFKDKILSFYQEVILTLKIADLALILSNRISETVL
jgi:hypothetical protein